MAAGRTTAARRRRRRKMTSGFSTVRDLLSYLLGLAVIGYEVFAADKVDWGALLVGMGLMGLPLALGAGDPRPAEPAEAGQDEPGR